MSGKFYVIMVANHKYFADITATGRTLCCERFKDAAKIFDWNIRSEDEVHELARKIRGQVNVFSYNLVSGDLGRGSEINKIMLDDGTSSAFL